MMLNENAYFVTGIGTGVGKTLVSAILVNALQADYWKPLQCGNLENTDSDFIRKNSKAVIFPERYKLKLAASPHLAAMKEKKNIELKDFILPVTQRKLIVEGAGGMMVPINKKNELVIDIAKRLVPVSSGLPLIIVAGFYLGSINHTLLTLEFAKAKKMKVGMVVFSGERIPSTEMAIRNYFPDLDYAFIPQMERVNKKELMIFGDNFKKEYLS